VKKASTAPKKNASLATNTEAMALTVEPYAPTVARGAPLAPRGSIVVYLAASGSKGLTKLRESAQRGKPLKTTELEEFDRAEPEESLRVALRYAGTLLADSVPVPRDGRVVRLILPYNGGELFDGGLTLHGEGIEKSISAVALRHDPPLTRVERAALDLVPASLRHLHVGAALPGALVGNNDQERRRQEDERRRQEQEHARQEANAARAEAQAEAQAARAEARAERGGQELFSHLFDSTIQTMSPAMSAAAMLQLRRDSLRGR
jgi:FKBP-type peptidyl-prolyl cis-trans isomerase